MRARIRALFAVVAATMALSTLAVAPVSAAPLFQMPFPCGETWRVHTSATHSPSTLAVDMNVGSGNDDLGRAVVASAAGTVDIREAAMTSYGHYIVINHGGGWTTYYAHLQSYSVADGAQVQMGQQIGKVGNNNGNLSAHLHHEQRFNNVVQWVTWNGTKITYKNYPNYVNYTSKNCVAPPPPPPPSPSWSTGFSSLGTPPTGGLTSGPDPASWEAGRLDVFARGTGNKLEHKWRTATGGWATSWESPNLGAPLGLTLAGDPTAVSWGPGRVDVFAKASDGNIYRKYYNGQWSNWENLLAPLGGATSDPDVSSRASNRLDVFVTGLNGNLHQKTWNGTSWSAWSSLGRPAAGALNSSPSAVSWDSGRIDVFARGVGNRLYHKWFSGGVWSGWEDLCSAPHPGCYLFSAPDVSSWAPGRLDVFIAGDAAAPHRLYHKWYSGSWSGWENLCVSPHAACDMIGGPGSVSWGSQRIDVFVRGTDNKLYTKTYGIQ